MKTFLGHVRTCRLTYNIPSMVPRDELLSKMSYDNHKYFVNKKKKSRSRSRRTNRSITSLSKKSREVSLGDSKDLNFMIANNKTPTSLFSKLRAPTSPKSSKDFISHKAKIQKLRLSSKGSVERQNNDLTGSYVKFEENEVSFKKRRNKSKN